jgi:hypothetical protein
MSTNTTAQLLSIFQRHVNAAFTEAIQVVSGPYDIDVYEDRELGMTEDEIGELADALLADAATWQEIGAEEGVTQRWPDGNVDTYKSYVTYRGEGGAFGGLNLALGVVEGDGNANEVVGFVLGTGGGSRRPLTVFFPADDYETTGERLSMIRGKGGGNSRKGYGPEEPLPPAYSYFKTDILGERIAGKWNVKAVVATGDADGTKAMLNHTALQARLRGIA